MPIAVWYLNASLGNQTPRGTLRFQVRFGFPRSEAVMVRLRLGAVSRSTRDRRRDERFFGQVSALTKQSITIYIYISVPPCFSHQGSHPIYCTLKIDISITNLISYSFDQCNCENSGVTVSRIRIL